MSALPRVKDKPELIWTAGSWFLVDKKGQKLRCVVLNRLAHQEDCVLAKANLGDFVHMEGETVERGWDFARNEKAFNKSL
jgi:hypothetical protein